jgi:membrane protease subunit HflK
VYVVTGFYSIQPNEQAVVRRCGEMLPELSGPGLHFGFPYGIDQVTRVRMAELKRVSVCADLTERTLGRGAAPQQAECLTGDRNLLTASAVVQYRVVDARAFLFRAADVPGATSGAATSALSSVIASMKVDDILTIERVAIQNTVMRATQETLNRYGLGVQVTAVTLEGVAPPQEVAEAFRDVTAAREDRARALNEAQGYANRLLPQARGEAQRTVLEAQGFADEVVQKARGDADRFLQVIVQLGANRALTEKRLILETMEEVLPRLNKVVLDHGTRQELDLGILEGNAP